MAAPKRKNKGGRPRAFDDAKRRKAVTLAKDGLSLRAIANILGVSLDTLAEERKREPEFHAAMLSADGLGQKHWIDVLKRCGAGKGSSVQLRTARFMLTHKWWQDWAERKPDAPTPERIVGALTYLFDRLRNELPKEHHGKIDESLHELAKLLDPQSE